MERKGEKNIFPLGGPKKRVVEIDGGDFELANRQVRAPVSHSNERVKVVDSE